MARVRYMEEEQLFQPLCITLGTIQVLRQHVFGFFRPTHLRVNQQKWPFSDPTHPLLH